MKYLKQLAAFCALTGLALAHGDHGDHAEEPTEESTTPSDVVVLTKDNFDSFIKENPLVLAEFYAPWCGHCKALAPEYEVAATALKEKKIPIGKVDCTEQQDLCQKFEVQGYPTLKVFRGEENTPYSGARKSDAIISFMSKQALPPVSEVTAANHDEFKGSDKVVVVAYLGKDDKEATTAFTGVADKLRNDFLFGATDDATLAEKAGVKAPAVVLYKTYDDPATTFDGKLTAEELTKFVKTESVPLIGEVGPDTYQGYMSAGIPLAYLFVEGEESKKTLTEAIRPIAVKHKGKINFATIDAVAFGAHAPNLNLEAKWPAFAIQETVKNQKFPFSQDKEITHDAIAKFVDDFVAGKMEPSIKSEEVPEKQEGPVHVVVAKNYQDIVIDNEKDVLLEFYAPWCGHCKNLAPKYEELGALYFNNPEYKDKVIVAKVDATANDVPDEIQGFPTIKLFKAGSKDKPIDYSGARTVEDLANFIRDNGKFGIDAYKAPNPVDEAVESEKAGESTSVSSAPASEETEAHDEL